MQITIGIDFGSDSVRAIAVDARNGEVLGEGMGEYSRWKQRLYCDARQQIFRHHPLDYLEAMEAALHQTLSALDHSQRSSVRAIGVDATGSTVCPVNENGVPLALLDSFAEDPDAMFHLWKDHSAAEEAREINAVFDRYRPFDYRCFQGDYSAEWFWAKILHTVRNSERVRKAAITWVELADWIPALLSGRTHPSGLYRCVCAAGHKALWNSHFGGLPSMECLDQLDPYLGRLAQAYTRTPGMSTDVVGTLSREWQQRLSLPQTVLVGGSSLDAHAGAVGAGICPGTLVKVVGTSTVDMAVIAEEDLQGLHLKGVCGVAQNSILLGYVGLEAGQASFGDMFAWFVSLLSWPLGQDDAFSQTEKERILGGLLPRLEKKLLDDPNPGDVICLDWFNGRRYPTIKDGIRASVMGLTLGTDTPQFYRGLVCAAVMGSKSLFNGYQKAGLKMSHIIATGGIAQKSSYVMQMLSDALERTVSVPRSQQTCALGAAMYAAVACGIWENLPHAQQHMGSGFARVYRPNAQRHARLEAYYQDYCRLAAFTDGWYQ